MQSNSPKYEKIKSYILDRSAYSIHDRGLGLVQSGGVKDCAKAGRQITGVVVDEDGESYSVQLDVDSRTSITAHCDCSTDEEMREQWCAHAVALLIHANELDFLDSESGFDPGESRYRMNSKSPVEIASMMREVSAIETKPQSASYRPDVQIFMEASEDRLGVQVLFDGEVQTQTIFDGFETQSERSLDSILLQILDDEGNWDDFQKLWYINSSKSIERTLGLIQEYDQIHSLASKEPITFERTPLKAKLQIEWHETSAELVMFWLLPEGREVLKSSELLGTGPFWVMIENSLFKIAPDAARIASIFPYSSTITLSRAQVGPILEVINEGLFDQSLIRVINPELQPDSTVKNPKPVLELERKEFYQEQFASGDKFVLRGNLEFQYPQPPEDKNIVYLPNREKEQNYIDFLKSLGFDYEEKSKTYEIDGDSALDLVYKGKEIFPRPWSISGLDQIKKGLRFAELDINVTLTSSTPPKSTGKKHGIDWFDCHISLVQNSANVPLSLLFKNSKPEHDKWIKLDSGAFAMVPGGGLRQLQTSLGMLAPNFKLSNTIKTKLHSGQAISFARSNDPKVHIDSDKKLKALAKKLAEFDSIDKVEPTKSFEGDLRPYQRDGLSWLNFLNDFGLDGILADEMGLGKTVQTLALLQLLKDSRSKTKKLTKPSLVVAPTSVITNWAYEARRFTPKMKVLLLHGPQRKQHFKDMADYDIVITSYALLRLDRYELERCEFGYVILDEAQNIKNPQAATTKAAKAMNSERRLALTGTPTENRPMELWSIIDFLMPSYLGSHDFFRTNIEKPIIEDSSPGEIIRLLNSKTRPFILRRMKHDVEKQLPPKIESVVHVPMSNSQRELYGQILEEVRPRVFDAVEKRGIKGASVSILAALLRLRQVCNHPNSIESLKDIPGYESGKFELAQELISEAIDSGRKILLFSQFREMLSIIRRWLEEQKVNFLYLDGATRNRQDLVDQFNNDNDVRLFLISLKAGGTGLNLTAADTVIIYDPWWNPAVESQAVDRAHRIGQTKNVSVYRLVTENSIEQKIMELKERKGEIVDVLVNENGLSTLNLSAADLESFFSPIPSI